MKINKRFLQVLAALWIIVFHLWINLSGTVAENFIVKIGYVGVDLFFFLAAYSLADKELEYGGFIKNRFGSIYVKFAAFGILMAVLKGWNPSRLIKMLLGIELFEKGGGAFLWFLPALMIFYLSYPWFLKWNNKYKVGIVLALWLCLSLISEKCFGYNQIFIFTNRIPALMAGYVLKKRELPKWAPITLTVIGTIALYYYGFGLKLNAPIYSFYFVLGLMLVVGLVGLSSYVPESRFINLLGGATLETYGVQMVLGFQFANWAYELTKSGLTTNLLTITFVWVVALIFENIYGFIRKGIENGRFKVY